MTVEPDESQQFEPVNPEALEQAVNYGTIWLHLPEWELPEVQVGLKGAEFKRLDLDEAAALAEAAGADNLREIQRRFSRGSRCYSLIDRGKIAAYGWVSFDEEPIGELGLCVRLGEGEGYIWDCATLPEYRKRGLYTTLLVGVTRELHSECFRRVWIGSDYDNLPSIKGFQKAGFRRVADAAQFGKGGLSTARFFAAAGIPAEIAGEARRVFMNDPQT